MHPTPRRIIPIVILVGAAAYGLWWRLGQRGQAEAGLAASGTVEAVSVNVAAELGGRVLSVHAQEGDPVRRGQVLVQFDGALLQAQRAQAEAALEAAQANYQALAAGPASDQGRAAVARAELDLLLAEQALADLRDNAGLAAAQAQLRLANAGDALFDAERDLSGVQFPNVADYEQALADAQDRLAVAQSAQTINDIGALGASIQAAQDVVERMQDRLGEAQTAEQGCGGCDPDRLNRAQDNLNGALNNLQTLQLQYETAQIGAAHTIRDAQDAVDDAQRYLAAARAGPNARKLAIAEAKLALAQAELASALDQVERMDGGPDPDALQAAEARVRAAEAALRAARSGASPDQLRAALAQVGVAQAALDAVDTQLAKLILEAPVDGVVLTRTVEPGEIAGPGATLFVIGQLSDLTITVYVPEDRYGLIGLGQAAQVTADSFPGQVFEGRVTHIADQAEFTPRNVQTTSGRRNTVFAVKVALAEADGRLKPGMPADVVFVNSVAE